MTAAWPAELPEPLSDGYGLQPDAAFIRTDMDSGPARQRRRFSAQPPTRVPAAWLMSEYQLAVFEGWYESTIAAGADWFTVPSRNGLALQQLEARFATPWQAAFRVPSWQVSATLELRTRPVLSAEELAVVIEWGIDDVVAAGPSLHELVHVSLPGPLTW